MKFYSLVFGLTAGYMYWLEILNIFVLKVPAVAYTLIQIRISNGYLDQDAVKKLLYFVQNCNKASMIGYFFLKINTLETQLISLERCLSFTQVKREQGYNEEELKKPKNEKTKKCEKFKNGKIEFKNVSASYTASLPPLFDNSTTTLN